MLDNLVRNQICDKKSVGLTSKQVAELLVIDGKNELAKAKKKNSAKIFASQFKDVMVMILLISTVISVFLGEIYDAITIILIVLLNAILGFIQEFRTEKTLEALKNMTAPTARVYRDGILTQVKASEMVKGDIFEIESGDRVPCDALIIEAKGLFADESILTGEAVPAVKSVALTDENSDELNKPYIAYMGTIITKGNARCKAIATGMSTQMGKVSGMLEEIEDEQTPLQKKLAQLGKVVAAICIGVCIAVFAAGVLRGEPVFDMLMTGITIAIAAIPEGLPATVTIALALAVRRMLKQKALVHRLHSVETLGCASVICSDKTGTITENKMSVTKLYCARKDYDVLGTGHRISGEIKHDGKQIEPLSDKNLNELFTCCCLCNNAQISRVRSSEARNFKTALSRGSWVTVGDPTEVALLVASSKGGITKDKLKYEYTRIDEIPFDSETKCMQVLVKNKQGNYKSYAKGAVDILISRCSFMLTDKGKIPLTSSMKYEILKKNDRLASKALRLLALAYKDTDKLSQSENDMVFIGLIGMLDPPRVEAKKAIRKCAKAHIKTVMITGDHKITACAVAKEAGIMTENSRAVTGAELSNMDDDELAREIENISVFARVNPSHKLRIVKAFKKKGHIVAMTGDGVNDAPAIKEADIGVSMGITGTDVTKQAADVILLDDNFATLVSAVEQGRTIYANIRKFVRYLLSCNIGEVITMFVGIIMGFPIVLLPTQVLLVNLLTDGLPAIALGLEPMESSVMNNPPRKSNEGFFSDGLLSRIFFRGIFIGLGTLGCFVAMFRFGYTVNVARTGALLTLVLSQLIHVFECKSEKKNIFNEKYFSNWYLIVAVLISALIVVFSIYSPALQIVFSTVPLNLKQLLISVICSFSVPVLAAVFNFSKK